FSDEQPPIPTEVDVFSGLNEASETPATEGFASTNQSPDQKIAQAISYQELNEFDAALQLLRPLVLEDSSNMKARYFLAKLYIAMIKLPQYQARKADFDQNIRNHLNAVAKSDDPEWSGHAANLFKEYTMGRYDSAFGRRLSQMISGADFDGSCGLDGFENSRGVCYGCVGVALESAVSGNPFSGDTNNRLNPPPYSAKFFATGWNQKVDGPKFGLSRIFYSTRDYAKGVKAANEAPIGSVIVWDKCGSSSHGHIAIKTSQTKACADFCATINDTCGSISSDGHQRIIGVFLPVSPPAR
ncbi:MAG: hypothetical protein H3C47_09875, partial [Candidatus Cloacimonetes bacterium]|nr:hypothetical protein [Candidatus Cloacimonadota bacterium]